jgi:dipeptidyl aminopeptidase/acylaminoacyl peptidase
MEQQRATARLGRLLSCLAPRATSGQESVGAAATAPPPSAVQAAAVAAAPAPPPLASGYRLPPKEIADIVDAPPEPLLSFSPDRTLVLQLSRPASNPPISELARPELKLAGLRIDPETFSRSRMSYYTGITFAPFTDDLVMPVAADAAHKVTGIPDGYWINYVTWSPDSKTIAFTLRSAGGDEDPPREPLELWVADMATGQARRLLEHRLNSTFEDYDWIDEDTIVAAIVPPGLGSPPRKPITPLGPKIEDNSDGRKSQARTYPDLLQGPYDEHLFDYYCQSQLVTVKVSTGEVKHIGPTRLYTATSASPDGRYLLVSWLERPYSYSLPCGRFPKRVQLWTREGEFVREIAALPLAEDIPVAFDSCRKGPRGIEWRDDKPAEMSWMECQDGGDPAVQVSPRDVVYCLDADAAAAGAEPRSIAGTDFRCRGVSWGTGSFALLYEAEWKTRRSITTIIAPDEPDTPKKVLFDRMYEDAYTDPGSPASRRTEWGTYVLALVDGERKLLMQGSGASPEGNRPFLDLLEVDSKETKRIWQSEPPFYEYTSSILSDLDTSKPISLDNLRILACRESVTEPPQFYIKTFTKGGAEHTERCLSHFPHPYPTLKGLQKEIIKYKRADGLELNGTLYLPPGYDVERDGPLPTLLYAYPREYKNKEAAGQLRKSPCTFPGIGSSSPLLFLARKYAVLDGPGFPIVAEGDEEPNDTYVEQLTACAQAAVDELQRRGISDPSRIAVAGHSYGAFMTANLLAHAGHLFACGIARSGAYNRTLTPFGFQAEERTYWQAAETYQTMSPFTHADKIKKPLLLIHGEADNNTGTFPMQSERFYQALKGHGATTRLVLLPHESHGYSARESVMHVLHEMDRWMSMWLNGAPPSDAESD